MGRDWSIMGPKGLQHSRNSFRRHQSPSTSLDLQEPLPKRIANAGLVKYRNNWIKCFKRDRLERLVFVQFDESFTDKLLVNESALLYFLTIGAQFYFS